MRSIHQLALGLLLSALALAQQPPSQVTASPLVLPVSVTLAPVSSAALNLVGNPGPGTYCYFAVANYVVGATSPSFLGCVNNVPNVLSGGNYVQITPVYPQGATVDILRVAANVTPTGACNCAVQTGVASGPINDQSASTLSYTVNPFVANNFSLSLANEVVGSGATHAILRQNGAFVADLSTSGAGTITGSGTPAVLPLWSGTSTNLGNSPLSVATGTVTVADNLLATGTVTGTSFTGTGALLLTSSIPGSNFSPLASLSALAIQADGNAYISNNGGTFGEAVYIPGGAVAADQLSVGSGAGTFQKDTLPNCVAATCALGYNTSTHQFTSQTTSGASPLTTNGDLYIYNGGNARLAFGSNGQFLYGTGGLPGWNANLTDVSGLLTYLGASGFLTPSVSTNGGGAGLSSCAQGAVPGSSAIPLNTVFTYCPVSVGSTFGYIWPNTTNVSAGVWLVGASTTDANGHTVSQWSVGPVPNGSLANSATTVNGQTCTLGSTCTVTAVASSAPWSSLTAAASNLTLANAGFNTTFQQTSNVNWTWANTTVATSGTSNSSPILGVAANYWTGSASAGDTWTLSSALGSGTNGTSTFQLGHTGSSGTLTFDTTAAGVFKASAITATSIPTPGAIGGTTPGAGTFTTLTGQTSVTAGVVGTTAGLVNLSGGTSGTATLTAPAVAGTAANPVVSSNNLSAPALVSTVSTGTAPLTVTSTTNVANLNASSLSGNTFAAPGAIGGTTPAAGTFTTLTGQTSVTAGVVGTTAGLLNLSGSTSGTATLTAPAVAGTLTNAVVSSNNLNAPAFTASSTTGGFNESGAGGSYQLAGHKMIVSTAPTVASGFGTGPSIPNSNGTAAFTVNVGTGGTATSGVITMPAANAGWACMVAPNGAPQAAAVTYSAPTSTTSITLTNYTLTTGVALAWTASFVLQVTCVGY